MTLCEANVAQQCCNCNMAFASVYMLRVVGLLHAQQCCNCNMAFASVYVLRVVGLLHAETNLTLDSSYVS